MNKLKLEIDALTVDTFQTTDLVTAYGTVEAQSLPSSVDHGVCADCMPGVGVDSVEPGGDPQPGIPAPFPAEINDSDPVACA